MIQAERLIPFILHEEGPIRCFAVNYFAEGYIENVDKQGIMNLVLQSCEMYPQQEMDNRLILSCAKKLPQTEETITIIIERLKQKKEINFWYEGILREAAPKVLTPYLPEMEQIVSLQTTETVLERQHLMTQETESLWKELLRFGDEAEGKYINQFNYKYGEYVAWELANREDLPSDRIVEQFRSYQIEDYYGYTNIYLAKLIGERRLEEAVPMLTELLASEGDLDNEIGVEALVKIGSIHSIELIKERFPKEDYVFHLFASDVLARIKCKESEQVILELLKQEEDDLTVIATLANGLCQLLSVEGIPVVKNYIDEDFYDRGVLSLEEQLYITCVIADVELSELLQWKEEIEVRERNYNKDAKKLPMLDLLSDPMTSLSDFHYTKSNANQRTIVNENKIGRNDPCSCGSGKKYKKCCGK
jgi:hypothetical protein